MNFQRLQSLPSPATMNLPLFVILMLWVAS